MPRSSRSSGPSAQPTARAWPSRWLSPLHAGAATEGPYVAGFIEAFGRVTKDTVGGRAGDPLRLRPWQRSLLDGLYARRPDGRRRHRSALVGMPRKNGKSALGSGIALYGLFAEVDGAEVYSCAGDREQARIVFGVAKRMVELEPELDDLAKLYRDAIEVPSTGSVYRALSAEAYSKEGLNPTLVVFDEVHVQANEDLWSVMTLGSGARAEPLTVGITTAGVLQDRHGRDTLCYRLYKHGCSVAAGEVDDPSFFFAWWEPRDGTRADHRDPAVWAESNPGFGDLVDAEDFASTVVRTPESDFRTKRTNVFTAGRQAWLPFGSWEACVVERPPPEPGTEIVLGFDGSHARDTTALVAATLGGEHLWVVRAWERPLGPEGEGWRVPRAEVADEIRSACRRWDVLELAFDPYRWADLMGELAAEGVPAVEFPQSAARMVPASEAFRSAVLDGRLSHDGDPAFAADVRNAVTHTDALGTRLSRGQKDDGRHIDRAVAAVMARERAAWWAANRPTSTRPDVRSLADYLDEDEDWP